MVELYERGAMRFTLEQDEKQHVYVHTKLQTFKVVLSNANGQHAINRIAKLIREEKITSFNELVSQCGKSAMLKDVSPWR